jgi:K+-transporting ATPase c subunit
MIKKGNAFQNQVNQMNNDAQAAKQNIEETNPNIENCLQNGNCTTSEEAESEDIDEELQFVTQSGSASQEEIEAAEVAAENAAEAAEAAAESLEEGIEAAEVIDAMLEMLADFI